MSITISVGASGATTGRTEQIIPGDGAIDTKEEAEAALAYLPEGSANTVSVGNQSYTRAQLVEIRDRAPKGEAKASGEAVAGEGVSHGVAIEGNGTFDRGDAGHGRQGARVTYRPSIPLLKGSAGRLHLDLVAGLDAHHGSRGFSTPGGEPVDSAYTSFGGVAGADARYVLPVWQQRLFTALGIRITVGSLSTKESSVVSTPGKCTPGEFGRADCEPAAGPRSGNGGTQGLWNPDLEAARGTSGITLGFEIPLTLGGTVVRGEWGSLNVFGGPQLTITKLAPSDGHGFSFLSFGGFGGVGGLFGGSDAYVPQKSETPPPAPADADGDGVPDAQDKCADTPKGTKVDANGCPVVTYEAKITDASTYVKPEGRFAIAVDVSAKSEVTVQFKDAAGKLYNAGSANVEKGASTSEFRAPSSLTSGKYKLVVTMKDPETKVEKIEEREIAIVERIDWTVPGSFAPGQPPTAQDVKVVGQPKLEGVSYVIVAFDKDGKQVGEIKVADKPGTIEDKKGTRIAFKAPDINGKAVGWQKDVNYRVALLNKDGNVLDVKSFEIGQAPAPKGGGGRRRL